MSAARPVLGAFLNGVPDVENLFPILQPLHDRGRVALQLFVTTGLWRRERRARTLLRASGIPLRLRPNRLLKAPFYYRRLFGQVDGMLVIRDPKIDMSVFRDRVRAIADYKLPTIWVQHGVVQFRVAYSPDDSPTEFHSDPILYWEDAANHTALLAPDVLPRILVTGFTKRPVFPVCQPPERVRRELARYRKRVLFCHTFRGETHDITDIRWCYELIREFCRANPDVLVIVRPHRGKVRKAYNMHDTALGRDVPNVMFSLQHSGPLRGLNMNDALHLADCMVSTPSTAVLDSLFKGLPTAVIACNSPQLARLPALTDLASFQSFLDGGLTPEMERMRNHYGSFERNIALACDAIEERMLSLRPADEA